MAAGAQLTPLYMKLCGERLHWNALKSYCSKTIAKLMQGLGALKAATAHVTRGEEFTKAKKTKAQTC